LPDSTTLTKMFVTLTLALCCWLGSPTVSANAWGNLAHRIVGRVAAEYLSPHAQDAVVDLLGSRTLADVANDADQWRSSRPETSPWHYVNIPFPASTYNARRDCPAGDCVIVAITRYRAILTDHNQTKAMRREALIFLVHFVADVHQPLHCIDNHDRGGNDVEVIFFGDSGPEYNLHSVWDTHLINRTHLGERAYAHRLMTILAAQNIDKLQRGTAIDWALESHEVAREHAYQLPPDREIRSGYYSANLPVLDNQLAKAAVRLARLLNEALR